MQNSELIPKIKRLLTHQGVTTRESNNVLVAETHGFAKHFPQVVRTCSNSTAHMSSKPQTPSDDQDYYTNEKYQPFPASGRRPSGGGSGLS